MRSAGLAAAARAAALVVLSVGTLAATATVRMTLDGRSHLRAASRARAAGRTAEALVEYEDAARSYAPGSPYPRRALEALAIMARAAEMRGETDAAAWTGEVVRRSILSTRHVMQPNRDLLERAERELRRLRSPREPLAGETVDPAARPRDPSAAASLVLFAGLALWIAGSFGICLLFGRREGAAPRLRTLAWVSALGGLALWIAMSWLAG